MSFPTCLLLIQDAAMIFKMARCLLKSRVVFKYPARDHFRFSLDLFISGFPELLKTCDIFLSDVRS